MVLVGISSIRMGLIVSTKCLILASMSLTVFNQRVMLNAIRDLGCDGFKDGTFEIEDCDSRFTIFGGLFEYSVLGKDTVKRGV